MSKIIKQGEISWISDNNILFYRNQIPLNIRGCISIPKESCQCCEEIYFFNEERYKEFSNVFSYCIKRGTYEVHSENNDDPEYHGCRFSNILGVSKLYGLIILATRDRYDMIWLSSWNPKTKSVFKIKKLLKESKTKNSECSDPNCPCQKKRIRFTKCPKTYRTKSDPVYTYNFLNEMIDEIKLKDTCCQNPNLKFSDMTVIGNFLVFVFRCCDNLYLVKAPFSYKNSVVTLDNDHKILRYNLKKASEFYKVDYCGPFDITSVEYDKKNSRILIVTSGDDKTVVWYLKWFDRMKTFNYVIRPIYNFLGKEPNQMIKCICFLSDGKMISLKYPSDINKFPYTVSN